MQKRLTRRILSLAIGAVLMGWGLAAAQEPPHETQQRAAASSTTEAKAGGATSQDEIALLKKQLSQQQTQIDQLLRSLQQMKERLDGPSRAATQEPASTAPAGQVASLAPVIPSGTLAPAPTINPPDKQQVASLVPPTPGTAPVAAPAANPQMEGEPLSPLQLHVGGASITPIGFMDFTAVYRSHDTGNGIGTNFGSIPYGSTYNDNLSEFRESMQNSRVGFRVDADVVGAHVIGYMEADFLGNNPTNVAVTSNSNTMRSRLYWVDFQKGDFELLGGQTWSLITPGRTGLSPLPGDVFYSQDMDVNYQAGLVWGRIPELRLVYHDPSRKWAVAVALDSPEQYVGGSSGGGLITFPAALATSYAGELNVGTNTLGTPNIGPDVIAKFAADPYKQVHFEFGGVERNFKVYNPTTAAKYNAEGGGLFANVNFDLFPGFRVYTNNYWSDGGGRYIFGQAPDLIVKADGDISLVHSSSTVSGFEYTHHNTLLFAYYGGIYIRRNTAIDTNGNYVGYGYSGAPSGQNRAIQEPTIGFNQTFWKNPKYGAMSLIGQYSYLLRNPWSVATGSPKEANLNMVFIDLRYTLPGSAPATGVK